MGGAVESFCGAHRVSIHFSNALDNYTPCTIDVIALGVAHLVGCILVGMHWHQARSPMKERYRLRGPARVYQWCAFLVSLVCFVVPLFEFGARLGASQILISPEDDLVPYEYLAFALSVVFWFVTFMVLYRELRRFMWEGLWRVRFSLCLVTASQLARFSFIVQPDLTEQDEFYVIYMISVAGHLFLTCFALTQFPRRQDLVPLSYAGYEVVSEPFETVLISDAEVCPERRANIISKLLFSWISPLLRQGYRRPLEMEDIWLLDRPDHARTVLDKFHTQWKKELILGQGRGSRRWNEPSLFRALWKTVRHLILQATPLKFIVDAAQFSGPAFLDLILNSVDDNEPSWKGYLYAVAMFGGLLLGILAENQHFQLVMRAGFRLRSIITTEVQRKALYISPTDRAKFSAGQIFNFVASDSEAVQLVCQNILSLISSPLRMTIATVLLAQQLGVASIVAVAALIVMVPVQTAVVRWSARFIRQALKETDERAKLETEIVSGIDAVKCNAWEVPFWNRILKVRDRELAVLWKSFVLGAFNGFIVTSVPAIVSVLTFGVYILLGNEMTASKAFVSLTLLEILRFPMFQLPQVITQITQAMVSVKRLESFLKSEEQGEWTFQPPVPPGETAIKVHGDFTWDIRATPCLPGLKVNFKSGSLTAVVGPTGSGKSSLLSSIIGLMQRVSGMPTVLHGTLSLVPQSPFIVNASIKDNILFGREYNEMHYRTAIRVSSLIPDLEMLPGGDETELGEKGINVSGGQKQRIALARAVYSDSDICLLDDPLSALDAHVGRSVFYECIQGAMKGKTVLLVTNQLQYVHAVDHILYLNQGRIVEQGTYEELMKIPNGGFAQMMAETAVEAEHSTEGGDASKKEKQAETEIGAEQTRTDEPLRIATTSDDKQAQLVQKEKRSVGVVSLKVIGSYVAAMGGRRAFCLLAMLFVTSELIRVGSTVWLTYWTDQGDDADHGQMFYMWIYGGILLAQILMVLVQQLTFKKLGTIASRVLHENMVQKLIRAPMSFYHTTPVGRIVNRLTKDTSDIDKNLVDFLGFLIRNALQLVSTLILVGAVTHLTLPILVPVVLVFFFLYSYFQATAREIKRLDSISRSPVYSSINDVAGGLATIRAFGAEKRVIERHMNLVDDNIIMSLINQSINRWLSIRLETIGGLVAFAAAVLSLEQERGASFVGLTISYALSVTPATAITIRLASLAETIFNSVERVAEYAELEEEAAVNIPGSTPDHWPDQGGVAFSNVKMSYRPGLPLVLKGLSAKIEPSQRVGVVGRTGAGKSSLMNVLFRTVELSQGCIMIDGVDTSKIGLRQLRSRIAIIPQVPFLFTGSVRINLDPFNDHSDEALWTALNRAHLGEVVRMNKDGLDMHLQEGGAPLSTGQIQLLSLARAIVRDTKILILDEATANVDVDTDALIQETIKAEFKDKTVIAIAHRLHTIIDGDRVMVLDKGTLAEFDTPANLLRNPDGIFTSMVRNTGEASERFLRSVAFGEVDMSDALAEDAAKGLERMASVRSQPLTGWTNDLLNSAHQALKFLSSVREQLADRQVQQRMTPPSEIETAQEGYVASGIQDTLELVHSIEKLAREAKMLLKDQGIDYTNAALMGGPMMESLALSGEHDWDVPRSSPVEIARTPSTRRRSFRRSNSSWSDRQPSM